MNQRVRMMLLACAMYATNAFAMKPEDGALSLVTSGNSSQGSYNDKVVMKDEQGEVLHSYVVVGDKVIIQNPQGKNIGRLDEDCTVLFTSHSLASCYLRQISIKEVKGEGE